MNQTQFINARALKCPGCDSVDISQGALQVDDGMMHRHDECLKCKATWTAQFVPSGFSNFRKGK
jgi:DNA-directed RNA polymerase subunit M/transcription elongation factor TFIIS